MIRSSVCTLIAQSPDPHGIYDTVSETGRKVFCEVASVTRVEAYEALSHGYTPALVLVLGDYAEYQDEALVDFEGKRYSVIRTYVRGDNRIELTVERVRNA